MSLRIAILGAGPGGYVAAIRAAQLGAEVTLVEREAIGGTCLNWGCIPTKTLKTSADLLDSLRRAESLGVNLPGPARPDLARMMARKKEVVETLAAAILKILRSHKVRFLRGEGRVLAPDRVRVAGAGQGDTDVACDRLILAPGSRPLSFPAFPLDGERILSSDHALQLQEIPASVLILGGGVVGCEFAAILSGLGTRVTLVEAMDRLIPLPGVDRESVAVLQREMKKRKVQVHLRCTVERAQVGPQGVRATVGPSPLVQGAGEGGPTPLVLEAERMLVTVGRCSNATGIGLEELGVGMDDKGWIAADARMETNVAGVYAIGDALGPGRVMLAHAASAEGIVAAENALGADRTMDYDAIPSGIFTSPEVADVGLTEEQARERGLDAGAELFLLRGLGKAQALGDIAGHAKIIWERASGRLLGVHLIGPHATDLIAEATLALHMGAAVKDVAHAIHAHPTLSEALQEAAHKALGAGIHCLKGE